VITFFTVASILASMAALIAYIGWLAYSHEKTRHEKNSLKELNNIYEKSQKRHKKIDLLTRHRVKRVRKFMRDYNMQTSKNRDAK